MSLADELADDPELIGYAGMTPPEIVVAINALTRPGPGDIGALRNYFLTNTYKSDEGVDTVNTCIWGRLEDMARTTVGINPYGGTTNPTRQQIHSAMAFLRYLDSAEGTLDLTVPGFAFRLNQIRDAQVIENDDKLSILAISENKQSRAREIGLGTVKLGHVIEALA